MLMRSTSTCCLRVWKLWPSTEGKVSEGVEGSWAAVWPCHLTPLLPGWYMAMGGPSVQQFVMV